MTDREKAIVMAHTGICMLEGEKIDVFYQYLYELYNRPVYTHELITLDIKEKSKSDFLQLCEEEEPKREKIGKWEITDAFPHIVYCGICYKRYAQTSWQVWKDGTLPRNYCPNCGARMVD